MTWVTSHLQGGNKLYQCADSAPGYNAFRESRAPRATTCLIEGPSSASICRYRAAWGEFSVTGKQCASEITSKAWGWREMNCSLGDVAKATGDPRQWKRGNTTLIDYEHEVPDDFVPPLPDNARVTRPFVRFLKRTEPNRLKQMGLTKVGPVELQLPFEFSIDNQNVKRDLVNI